MGRGGLKPIGPIAPNWALRPILQTLLQVDWEPGPTEIVPNWAAHLLRPALTMGFPAVYSNVFYIFPVFVVSRHMANPHC